MHTYEVESGIKCKIIKQGYGDIEVTDFVTRRKSSFGDEQVIIDFVRFKNSGAVVNSVATDLAAKGYYIFCQNNTNDAHLLAVHASNVTVM